MIVFALCALTLALVTAVPGDQTQLEKYGENKYKKYQLDVPGKEPISIIETATTDEVPSEWTDISVNLGREKDDVEIKNLMTDIIHDNNGDRPRCFGPSCQDGFVENQGPQGQLEQLMEEQEYPEKSKDFRNYSGDRLQAINALAAKLKNDKIKADRYYGQFPMKNPHIDEEEEDNGKVYTSWNRLKVKQHKHPYDDKDGWVTLEPVAWSTSKISKWKPNIKNKSKPSSWTQQHNNDDDRFSNDDKYSGYQGMEGIITYPQKRPTVASTRPAYINNKLHVTSSSSNWDSEMPSKPSWNKPDNLYSYPSTWNPDEGRRPNKPNCDSEEQRPDDDDDTVFYGVSDSVVTDNRPSYFPYEYEALKRPMRRPTQVVYVGTPDVDSERASRPPNGDGQWVLLSTTKGYRNKKRQRSLKVDEERSDPLTMTSHQAVGLTVLPAEARKNMTTSHGGLLEVERSFKTVEESKRDMDKQNEFRPDEMSPSTDVKPTYNKRVIRRKIISNVAPDSSAVLAAVGAGMVPATMAMVVPMMLGKRKRRDIQALKEMQLNLIQNRGELME